MTSVQFNLLMLQVIQIIRSCPFCWNLNACCSFSSKAYCIVFNYSCCVIYALYPLHSINENRNLNPSISKQKARFFAESKSFEFKKVTIEIKLNKSDRWRRIIVLFSMAHKINIRLHLFNLFSPFSILCVFF